jgi:alpha/beta superfamily hydrolase
VTVAPAVSEFPAEPLQLPSLDWFLIQGDSDDIVPADRVMRWLESQSAQPRLVLLDGVDHFFHGRLNSLRQTLIDAL